MKAFTQSVGPLVLGASLLLHGCTAGRDDANAAPDHLDAEYLIGSRPVKLTDGVAETEAAPGSASRVITRSFGNEVRHDFNGDGREDIVFLLTQETGGSGVYYYVVAAVASGQGFAGSDGVLLGDRIAPQTIEVGANDIVTVNYADRAPGESFATPPSQAKSIRLLLDATTMRFGVVAQDFEGEANPARMTLDMKPWTWISARYGDGREVVPRQPTAFTVTFSPDGAFTATTDCNRIGGGYTAVDNRLTFGDVFGTRMFCEGSQETDFTAMLTSAVRYRFTSRGQLILELGSDGSSAEFR